jgi:hypothetical protein
MCKNPHKRPQSAFIFKKISLLCIKSCLIIRQYVNLNLQYVKTRGFEKFFATKDKKPYLCRK